MRSPSSVMTVTSIVQAATAAAMPAKCVAIHRRTVGRYIDLFARLGGDFARMYATRRQICADGKKVRTLKYVRSIIALRCALIGVTVSSMKKHPVTFNLDDEIHAKLREVQEVLRVGGIVPSVSEVAREALRIGLAELSRAKRGGK